MNLIKVGVVGAGKMGSFHCTKLKQMKNVDFIGIFDKDSKRAREISQRFQIQAFDTYSNLLQHVDAIIVAAPTRFHFTLVEEAIRYDKHVFVEKPITTTIEEANKIKSLLKNKKVKFQVGHIERFNPVIQQLHQYIEKDKIINIEAKRLAFSDRIKDVDVVLDVMIHDIDIILSIVKSKIRRISAEGIRLPNTGKYDTVTALILFENGVVANLVSSNVSHEKVRTLTIYEKEKVIKTDYLNKQQQIIINELNNPNSTFPQGTETVIANLTAPQLDPLLEELTHFIDCIYFDKDPLVGVEEGATAVEVALQIKNCLDQAK